MPTASSHDAASLADPKALYRAVDELLDDVDPGTSEASVLVVFLERLLGRLGEPLGLPAGAAYQERRRGFHRLAGGESLPDDAFAPSFAPGALSVTREEPTEVSPPGGAAPWLETGVAGPTGSGATVVSDGRSRFAVALAFRDTDAHPTAELVLHTVRSVLTSHLQRARWGSTMREAAAIQRSLVPDVTPDVRGYDVAGVSQPAEEVGGDFFEALVISADSTGLVIGDASGHGLPAALVARDCMVGLKMGVDRDLRIAPILEKLNRIIHRGGPSSSFVSLFYGELEENGNLFYVNAGHKAPMLFRARKPADAPPELLFSGDIVLGPDPDTRFKRQFAHVDRGDCLVLYTDGVNERQDPPGEQFGDARIIETVRSVRDAPAREIARAVLRAAADFGEGAAWGDDATVLVVKRDP